jgi:hypothetical protein
VREYLYAEGLNETNYIGFRYSVLRIPIVVNQQVQKSLGTFFLFFFWWLRFLVFSFSDFWEACGTAVSGLSAIGHYQVPIDKGISVAWKGSFSYFMTDDTESVQGKKKSHEGVQTVSYWPGRR